MLLQIVESAAGKFHSWLLWVAEAQIHIRSQRNAYRGRGRIQRGVIAGFLKVCGQHMRYSFANSHRSSDAIIPEQLCLMIDSAILRSTMCRAVINQFCNITVLNAVLATLFCICGTDKVAVADLLWTKKNTEKQHIDRIVHFEPGQMLFPAHYYLSRMLRVLRE